MTAGFAQTTAASATDSSTTSGLTQTQKPPGTLLNLASTFYQNMTNVPANGRGAKLPANFPFLPAGPAFHSEPPQKQSSAGEPDFAAQDFVVKSGAGWYYVQLTAVADKTTAIDNTRVGPYTTPSTAANYHCTYLVTPLADYVASQQQYIQSQKDKMHADFQAWLARPKASGALTPVYLEFDIIRVFQAAKGVERLFAAGALAIDLGSGDYKGGLGPALIDDALGQVAKKIWRTVYKVPDGLDSPAKVKWLEQITQFTLGKTLPLPKP